MQSMALNAMLIASLFALAQTAPASTSYEQASKEITILLQQGNDDSACADLAKTLIDEVTATVDASNKLLGALDDGSSCPNEGQEAVTTAQNNKDDADKAASDAAEAASGAADADVDFGSFSFSSLKPGECSQFWEDEAYKSAKAAQATTATAQTEADAKAKVAAEAVDDATTAAAAAVQACQCKVRAAYDSAWAAATEKQDADAAAYTKGKHMQCVLQGTAAADCDVGDAPQVTPVTLADGVPAEPCDATEPEPEKEWHLSAGKSTSCDSGVQATQAECEAAVASLASDAGKTPARSLQVGSGGSCGDGSWGGVPSGCVAQSHGDWAAHFKTSGPNCNNGYYQVVCSGKA